MLLTIFKSNENNKKLAKGLEEANKKNQELLLEIEKLKNNNNKNSSNCSKTSSNNWYKKIITNNRVSQIKNLVVRPNMKKKH